MFVVGVRKSVFDKITNLGVICRVPIGKEGIWSSSSSTSAVHEPMSDSERGYQEDICQVNSYVVAVDIALRKYSRQDSLLGPTLHFVEPADIRPTCHNVRDPFPGALTSRAPEPYPFLTDEYQSRSRFTADQSCHDEDAARGLWIQSNGSHIGAWGMVCAPFATVALHQGIDIYKPAKRPNITEFQCNQCNYVHNGQANSCQVPFGERGSNCTCRLPGPRNHPLLASGKRCE
jgi:hypothetical protein